MDLKCMESFIEIYWTKFQTIQKEAGVQQSYSGSGLTHTFYVLIQRPLMTHEKLFPVHS